MARCGGGHVTISPGITFLSGSFSQTLERLLDWCSERFDFTTPRFKREAVLPDHRLVKDMKQ
jgi:hypothetical protein